MQKIIYLLSLFVLSINGINAPRIEGLERIKLGTLELIEKLSDKCKNDPIAQAVINNDPKMLKKEISKNKANVKLDLEVQTDQDPEFIQKIIISGNYIALGITVFGLRTILDSLEAFKNELSIKKNFLKFIKPIQSRIKNEVEVFTILIKNSVNINEKYNFDIQACIEKEWDKEDRSVNEIVKTALKRFSKGYLEQCQDNKEILDKIQEFKKLLA